MSLLRASSFKVTNQTLHETSFPVRSYVVSLTRIASLYAAAASPPSSQIHLFDSATLQSTGALIGHEQATTKLSTVHRLGASTREQLFSCGRDGCVIAWDERSGSAGIKMEMSGRPRPLLCCDVSDDGFLVAAGTELQKEDAFIIYWDPRNPAARLRTHGSTHSDDITAVHFLKDAHSLSSNKVLLSTSSDGLISTSNALETDEDEAIMYVGNWGCSISQAGWISSSGVRVWAASDMETFSCWSGELDHVSAVDIRNPSLHDHGYTWVTDYLITGHSTRKAESKLGMFVGTNEGDLALITSNDLSDAMAPWTIHSVWAGGHSGIVRCAYWDEEHDVLVTGGEDSKIITWRTQSPNFMDHLALDQRDVPMESAGSGSKRGWEDIMDTGQHELDSKRMRR